jgi:hypothetical protein
VGRGLGLFHDCSAGRFGAIAKGYDQAGVSNGPHVRANPLPPTACKVNMLIEFGRRLRMLLRRRQFDADLEEEMRLHRDFALDEG